MSEDFTVRAMQLSDLDAVVGLQAAAFPPPFPQDHHWQASHLQAHLERFPKGQFVAEGREGIVGSCSNTIISEVGWQAHGPWAETIGGPNIETFDEDGTTLYGLDITVHPNFRRQGIGRIFYGMRFGFGRANRLVRYGTGCRMPDFRASGVAAVEQYAEEVVAEKRNDRTMTPLLRYGLTFIAVVRGYMEDYESDNAGALLERTF